MAAEPAMPQQQCRPRSRPEGPPPARQAPEMQDAPAAGCAMPGEWGKLGGELSDAPAAYSRCGEGDECDGGAGIVTAAEFRRLALALPGTEEHEHMEHPDFRVGGKIFATLGYPDAGRGMVKLFPDQQAEFVAADPATFVPVKGAWGKQGCTHVLLKTADKAKVKLAMRLAWERAGGTEASGERVPAAKKKVAAKRRRA